MNACGLPRGGDLRVRNAGKHRHPRVGKPHRLQCLKRGRVARNTVAGEGRLGVDDDGDALKEPFVPSSDGVKFIQRHAGPNCLRDPQNAEGNEFAEPSSQRVTAKRLVMLGHRHFIKPGEARFHRAERLLQAFFKGAPDGHGFADGFHRGRKPGVRSREFFKGEARDLGDDIVDRRLETCRGDAGNVVCQLVQRVADSQFRRDLGNREAGCLRGQCR